jgi:hypothetical protein
MTTHNHDVLMAISSRIINGRKNGAKQLNADYRALVKARDEILKLREKLIAEQPAPVQEPIGYAVPTFDFDNSVIKKVHYAGTVPLYTSPPAAQRQWVGLTDEERDAIFELHHTRLGGWDHGGDEVMYDKHFEDAVAAIEAKLKEKNT